MPGLRAGILSAPPVWQQLQAEPGSLSALLAKNFIGLFAATSVYIEKHSGALLLFGLIAGALFALALQFRRMARATEVAAGVPGIALRRPFLVLAMLWLLLGPKLLMPELDPGLALLRVGLIIGILAVLLPEFVVRDAVLPLRGLLAATLLAVAESLLLDDPLYGRIFSLLLALCGIWLLRRLRAALLSAPLHPDTAGTSAGAAGLLRRVSLTLTRYAPPVLAIGMLAEAIGAELYGNQLISGVLYLAPAASC